MRTIFDGLVEEFRAWHLFEQQAGNSPRRDLPDVRGLGLPEYGGGGYGADGSSGPGYFGTPGYEAPGYEAPGYDGGDYDRAPRHGPDLGGAAPRPGGRR